MNKVKTAFILLLLSFATVLLLLMLMKPAPPQQQVTTGPKPLAVENPPVKTPVGQPEENRTAEVSHPEPSPAPEAMDTESVEVTGNVIDTPPVKSTSEITSNIAPELRDALLFADAFGRNIFQERIDLETPVLSAEKYEDPDRDGNILLKWDPVPLAAEYDLDINGVVRASVISPYTLSDLDDGEYFIKCIAKNMNGTSKWSSVLKLKVYKPKIVEKPVKENIRINFFGTIRKKGKFLALIDDKLFKEGDRLLGGVIVIIDDGRVVLEKKGSNYEFKIDK